MRSRFYGETSRRDNASRDGNTDSGLHDFAGSN